MIPRILESITINEIKVTSGTNDTNSILSATNHTIPVRQRVTIRAEVNAIATDGTAMTNLHYSWMITTDWSSDQTNTDNTSMESGPLFSRSFPASASPLHIELTVSNDSGTRDTSELLIGVGRAVPIAKLTYEVMNPGFIDEIIPTSGVRFDGSDSISSTGIRNYIWNFSKDGSPEIPNY